MTNVVHFLPLKVCISDTKGSSEFLSENAIGLHVRTSTSVPQGKHNSPVWSFSS